MQTQFHFKDCGKHPKTQPKTAQEHDTKSLPAAKPPTTTRKFLSLALSFAPSLLIKSVSRTTVLSAHTPRVGKCWLYSSVLGKSEIISLEVGEIKIKVISHILHLSKQLPPHLSRLVTCLRPRRKGILQAHPPHQHMERQEFKVPQQPFLHLLWAARSSDPI